MAFQKRVNHNSRSRHKASSGSGQISLDLTLNLLRAVEQTHEVELSCDEAFELFDQLAEMVSRGEDPSQILPLVQEHVKFCPDCREEFEALLRVLKASPSL